MQEESQESDEPLNNGDLPSELDDILSDEQVDTHRKPSKHLAAVLGKRLTKQRAQLVNPTDQDLHKE